MVIKAVDLEPELRLAVRAGRLVPSAVREILKATQQPDVISFAGGLPAPELFPVEGVEHASKAVLDTFGSTALQYTVTEGIPQLREWVAQRLSSHRHMSVSFDDVLITSGSQQGLDLIAKVLLDPGDVVAVEAPTYLAAIQAFDVYEAQYLAIPTDEAGIIPEALEAALRGSKVLPKFLYVIPTFQNPTGLTIPDERRDAIADICGRFGVPIVEDDPYGDLRFEGKDVRPVYTRRAVCQVIYLGTGSKILAPGLRVAWMIVEDDRLREKIVCAKQAADLHSATFSQYVFWEYARHERVVERQVETISSVYRARRDVMLEMMREHFPANAHSTRPEGGMFLWVTLPKNVDTHALLERALEQKVLYVPGVGFYPNRDVRNTLRLNFSNSPEAKIRDGMERLALALR